MPQIFKIGPYVIYFWSDENMPLEPIHVHVAEGVPHANATKIWITRKGKALLCHNNSKIPPRQLRKLMRVIEANSSEITDAWFDYFGEGRYFC